MQTANVTELCDVESPFYVETKRAHGYVTSSHAAHYDIYTYQSTMSDRGRTCRRSFEFDARRLSDPLLEPFQGTIEFHPRTRVEHVVSKFRWSRASLEDCDWRSHLFARTVRTSDSKERLIRGARGCPSSRWRII